jgi:hypothetical protein
VEGEKLHYSLRKPRETGGEEQKEKAVREKSLV